MKKKSNCEYLTLKGYDSFNLKTKIKKIIVLIAVFFMPVVFAVAQQSLVAVDDYATTGPMQKVRVNVVINDTLTCSDYVLAVTSSLNPVTQGTATVISGGFIEFMPSLACRNTTVIINYGLTCNSVQVTAKLTVHVTEYNNPVNVIDENVECYENMPANINFDINLKYRTGDVGGTRTGTDNFIDGFTSPLVGDLNGDGKPEIVIMGCNALSGGGAATTLSYINIYNGQTGERLYRYDFTAQSWGSDYGNMIMGHPYHRAPSILALADLDNDGLGEIVMCHAESGRVAAFKPIFSGASITGMTRLWEGKDNSNNVVSYKRPSTSTSYTVFGYPHPYIADINADGIPEVIVYNKIYNGKNGRLLMAWHGGKSSFTSNNSYTSTSGLQDNFNAAPVSTKNIANGIREDAMVGMRRGNGGGTGNYSDSYLPVPAIVDIDGDGKLEIITGNRIHFFNLTDTLNHLNNSYRTVEGPESVIVTENGKNATYYLNDGFTRVADIDGDGKLDIIVVCTGDNGSLDTKIIVYVWELDNPTVVKACISFYSDGYHGNFSIPFIGDINGKLDGWDGTDYTKKLPEICILGGVLYIDNASSRTGVKYHPKMVTTDCRFNQTISDVAGHIIGLTWDDTATTVENKLKVSWGMEHQDRSHNTGITLFDFDNNNTADLCYRDETTLRVISPGRSGKDYVKIDETVSPTSSVMFSTPVYCGTAFEYPVIADVNMDGSADILVTHVNSSSRELAMSHGWINVYEYKGQKWAPCPPVWNQGMYDPTMVREDLKINARPIPMLTSYTKNGETVYPYNGSWMQAPIVREDQNFTPVMRQPDAVLQDVRINVATNKIEIDVFNAGSATLSANTPVSFYNGSTGGLDIASSTFLKVENLGTDVFPGEKVTKTFTLPTGNYNNCLIWARVMANNTAFPPGDFVDCNYDNNTFAAIDCPYLGYSVQYAPSNVICGAVGAVLLKAIPDETPHETPTYQWYKDEIIIQGATDQIYFATEPGIYRCYVIEGICREYSQSVTVTRNYSANLASPNLECLPASGKLCINGSAVLNVNNFADYQSGSYVWIKDGIPFDTTSTNNINLPHPGIPAGQESGDYQVFVTVGSCSILSAKKSITASTDIATAPVITKTPADAVICGVNGSVLLQVTNLAALPGATFQWYRDGALISGATDYYYFATESGDYSATANTANGCLAFSNSINLTKNNSNIIRPQISREPASGDLCAGGSALLRVTNTASGYEYLWYKAGEQASVGAGTYIYVSAAGRYYAMALNDGCTSISAEINITSSPSSISKPEIESQSGVLSIFAGDSIMLRLKTAVPGATAYRWYRNGVAITGATGSSVWVKDAGKYALRVNTADCYSFSDELDVKENIYVHQITSGTDFWLAFGQSLGSLTSVPASGLTLQIKIATAEAANVTLEYTALSGANRYQTIPIPANTVSIVDLNTIQKQAVYNSSSTGTLTASDKSVHITSDVPVSVYALNYTANRSDATNVLPSGALGTDYHHISYNANNSSTGDDDAILAIATEDNTGITLKDRNGAVVKSASSMLKGGTFYYRNDADMTGYSLASTKPVACFAAHQGTMIPDAAHSNLGNLFQQMAPVHSWGKHFLVPDIGITNQYPLRLRIVASKDNTTGSVIMNGYTSPFTLSKKGDYKEYQIASASGFYISSNEPVAVCSYLLSYGSNGVSVIGEPAQVWIPPVEQATVKTIIAPFYNTNLTEHYAIVITSEYNKEETTVTVNGTTSKLNTTTWFDHGNSGYSFAKLGLVNAPYIFENTEGVIVLVVGFGSSNGYYMLGGASTNNLNMMFKVNEISYQDIFGQTLCTDSISLAATVEYAKSPLNLKWFINGSEKYEARNHLTYKTALPSGNYTVRMDVEDQNGSTLSVSTDFTVENKPVITAPAQIYVGYTANLSPSTGGEWTSSNTAVASIDNNGLATGLAKGEVYFTFTSDEGCSAASGTVVILSSVSAVNDTVLLFNDSVSFDALANDMFVCGRSQVIVNTLAGTGPEKGSLVINADKTFTYTPYNDAFGIDSVEYYITCGTDTARAKIYILVQKPLSKQYIACQDNQHTITIGMNAIPGVEYYWYSVETGGTPIAGSPANTVKVMKSQPGSMSWYAEARYNGVILSEMRYKITVSQSALCGTVLPSCYANGQLFFREDFGGNDYNYPRVSTNALTAGVTDYTFRTTDQISDGEYALVKYIDPNSTYVWHKNFSDHTNPNDKDSGYMLLASSDTNTNKYKFYETPLIQVGDLCEKISDIYISASVANLVPQSEHTYRSYCVQCNPKLKFELLDEYDNVLATYFTPVVPRTNDNIQWRVFGFPFMFRDYSALKLKIYNASAFTYNDLVLDDIEVHFCVAPVTLSKLSDSACLGSVYSMGGSYHSDGFISNDSSVWFRWEYSPVDDPQAVWTVLNESHLGPGSHLGVSSQYGITVAEESEGYYRLIVADCKDNLDNVICRIISKSLYLRVLTNSFEKPIISSVLGNYELCGTENTVTLQITNPQAGINYQWYKGMNIPIPGETGLSLVVRYSDIYPANSAIFGVMAVDTSGLSCLYQTDTIIIRDPNINLRNPAIASESGNTIICGPNAGIMLKLTTDYTGIGTSVSYQWYRNDSVISGAVQTHYYATVAGTYKIVVKAGNCSAQSAVISLTYDNTGTTAKPELESQGDITEICSGTGSLMLYVSNANSYSSTATYVWYRDNNTEPVLTGAGLHTYVISEPGDYSVYVYETGGCGSGSDTLTVTQGS
ncbi:MAG: Ig-like domain-containing protein, partial [Prevotellaceae bacterium]|nr:Ig-like domain-containing protein [Prevotellaceae bacterium]